MHGVVYPTQYASRMGTGRVRNMEGRRNVSTIRRKVPNKA